MESTKGAMRWSAMVSVSVLGALLVVIGPAADPASACSCAVPSDATAFEQSDAVFVGHLVGYEPPPTRDEGSSADPATWIFDVGEVYKGEVAAIQEIVSEVSGASCGLEIPREGEFLVFATEEGFDVAVGDDQFYAGLCGGTRSVSAGPLSVDAIPSPQESAQESPQESTSTGSSPAIVVVGVAFAVGVLGVAMLIWRRVG